MKKRIIKQLNKFIPDKLYLKLQYRYHLGEKLNLKKPKTYNEKIQWLKLYDRNPDYVKLVDKYQARKYISNILGNKYLVNIINVYDNVEDIDWNALPKKFVLKCTHGSQCNIICDDKSTLDIVDAKSKLKSWMKKNWYWYSREWPYKYVKPRIICEEFLEQEDGNELRDYRFFCFDGEPKYIAVDFSITDKSKTRRNVYDINWNLLDVKISYPNEKEIIVNKPEKLDEMLEICRKISKNLKHARIDLYYIEKNILFGEITLYHQGGYGKIQPYNFNVKMGDLIKL